MSAEQHDLGIPAHWPKPLGLLLALLHGGAPEAAARLAGALTPADWTTFADLAIGRHRVAPLIGARLQVLDMPDPIRTAIDEHLRQNVYKTLAHIAETRRICAALNAADAEPVIFKGWPLAEQLYGQASARHTGDVDMLLPKERVHAAYEVLTELGYAPTPAEARMMSKARWADMSKDVELFNAKSGIIVELHWHSSKYTGWPEILDTSSALTRHDSQAGSLLVPDYRANLLYLSQHGALHLWDRLKWLADIADLVRRRDPADLADDIAAARAAGIARPVIFALSLSSRLLGSPDPAVMTELTRADPWLPGLERWILARLAEPYPSWARLRYRLGTRVMGLRLSDDWSQVMSVVAYDTTRRLLSLSLPLPGQRVPKPLS